MAGVADHMALTGRTRLKRTIPFLMREGASVEGTWITREVVCFVIRFHGRRVRALTMTIPAAKCTASAMAFWRRAESVGRVETGTRFMGSESEVRAGRNASYGLSSGAMSCWAAFASRS